MSAKRRPALKLPIATDIEPMEAELANQLPDGDGWSYEPKWDGFRCLAFRSGDRVELQSKSGKPLARYFPDVVEAMLGLKADRFVLDGEIVIPVGDRLSFDDLLLRIHPAESRVNKLAASHPAHFVAFDLLVDDTGRNLSAAPLAERRAALELFSAKAAASAERIRLSPHTEEVELARRWLGANHQGLDGVMAKRTDLPYQSGTRTGMVKVKRLRTAECVVGGFRWGKSGDRLGSILLGLYDQEGDLHHVGFCSGLTAARRADAEERLKPLKGGEGFSGRAPSGASRWRQGKAVAWEAVDPTLVVEVQYDHFSGGRFRHGTRFLRWRPDKDPRSCTLAQVEREGRGAAGML